MLRPLTHACTLPRSEVFGSRLDIHTGGVDLAFPHHENEIAQSEVFHQCQQWGNYFLHSGKPGSRQTSLRFWQRCLLEIPGSAGREIDGLT